MKLRQLSVFAENKPGHLATPCRLLAEKGIDIRALSLADTQEFGILRLLVSDAAAATAMLEKAGHVVKTMEVVAVEIDDKPGALATLLGALDNGRVNIEYMYAAPYARAGKAVMIFRFDDPDQALAALKHAGARVVDDAVLARK
jgi:hypothetical protein